MNEPTGYDVVDTRTGHVTLRNVEKGAALSAADRFNAGRNPWPFKVYPTGTYQKQ